MPTTKMEKELKKKKGKRRRKRIAISFGKTECIRITQHKAMDLTDLGRFSRSHSSHKYFLNNYKASETFFFSPRISD